jgi:hypothetical protein
MWIVLPLVILAILAILFLPRLKGWRTQFFGAASVVVSAAMPLLAEITGYLKDLDWREYVGMAYAPYAVAGMAVVFMVLRYVTTGPVGQK